MKHFNVTVLNPRTGREEKHLYIRRDRIFQNADGESCAFIYGGELASEVIIAEEVVPPSYEAVTCNGRFSCE
tara:strand:- start:1184 stop:1399 length:216 start_codon:yes stop_codon:yes gene_type:complete